VFEIPAAFALAFVKKVDLAAFVGPDLFEIADRECLGGRTEGLVAITPDGVEVVVFREGLQKFGCAAGDDIDDATRKIAGLEDLIEVGGD
jgi:hypothetical protein